MDAAARLQGEALPVATYALAWAALYGALCRLNSARSAEFNVRIVTYLHAASILVGGE